MSKPKTAKVNETFTIPFEEALTPLRRAQAVAKAALSKAQKLAKAQKPQG